MNNIPCICMDLRNCVRIRTYLFTPLLTLFEDVFIEPHLSKFALRMHADHVAMARCATLPMRFFSPSFICTSKLFLKDMTWVFILFKNLQYSLGFFVFYTTQTKHYLCPSPECVTQNIIFQ